MEESETWSLFYLVIQGTALPFYYSQEPILGFGTAAYQESQKLTIRGAQCLACLHMPESYVPNHHAVIFVIFSYVCVWFDKNQVMLV